jgi:hypothetical protein
MSSRVILIVESNPKNTPRLSALSEEKRAIRNSLRIAGAEDVFTIETENAATIRDLGDAIVRYEPEIVHFMGHGEGDEGLCFHGDDGKKQLLPNSALDSIFERASRTAKLVFLNACYSAVQANIIAKHVDHVIGMSDKIPDQTALDFSKEFYRYLGLKKSVDDAFGWAMDIMKGLDLKDHTVPMLGGKLKLPHAFQDKPSQASPPKERVDTLVPSSPLLVIPTDPSHKIMADKHYLEVSTDIESHWGIVSPRRVSTVTELKRELEMDQHNIIYIYAKENNGEITLDKDLKSGQVLDLGDLASWFAAKGLRPLLILAITGRFDESQIPKALVEQTQFVWCLQTMESESGLEAQSKAIKHLVAQSALTESSLETIIAKFPLLTQARRKVKSHTFTSSSNLTLKVDAQSQREEQQFRAAFFRLVLGRRTLKSDIGMAINAHLGKTEILTYAVTGSKLSCAFEVPQQIDYHLATSAMGVTVINYPLHTTIDAEICSDERALETSITSVIEQNLKLGSSDLSALIKKKAEDYGIDISSGAIVFHWNINVEQDVDASSLEKWLTVWHDLVHDEFGDLLIPKATLVHALCIQVHDDKKVTELHDTTQRFFRKKVRKSSSQVIPHLIEDSLKQLKDTEIEDFFDDPENQRWAEYFKFKDHGVDSEQLSEWVCKKTNGEFESVVRELWVAQQTSYAEYKQG